MAETEFKYDVYISYSHKDEEWVVNTWLPAAFSGYLAQSIFEHLPYGCRIEIFFVQECNCPG
jgi:hypothetical protein